MKFIFLLVTLPVLAFLGWTAGYYIYYSRQGEDFFWREYP